MASTASIVIATDTAPTAFGIARQLAHEFGGIRISVDVGRIASNIENGCPAVLVLAFRSIDAAQCCLSELDGRSRFGPMPDWRIALCSSDELEQAYARCRQGRFDDYAVYSSPADDPRRLTMVVAHALHVLERESAMIIASQVIARTRWLASLEPALAGKAQRFARQLDLTRMAAQTVANGASHASLRRLTTVGQRVGLLCDAARSLAHALGPQLHAVRELAALAGQTRRTVLSVDMDAVQPIRLARLLDGIDVDVEWAASGGQAWQAIRRRRPDLVLMDADLPDVSGIELTRRLKSTPALASIPIIIVTAKSCRAIVIESVKAGASDFMVKPYCRATLLDKLMPTLPPGS